LEIAIIKATNSFPIQSSAQISEPENIQPKKVSYPKPGLTEDMNVSDISKKYGVENSAEAESKSALDGDFDLDMAASKWKQLLIDIKPFNHSLKALLANCQIFKVENKTITLATPYNFYRDKLNIPINKKTVEDVFGKILGSKVLIEVVLCKEVGIEPKIPESEKPAKKRANKIRFSLPLWKLWEEKW